MAVKVLSAMQVVMLPLPVITSPRKWAAGLRETELF